MLDMYAGTAVYLRNHPAKASDRACQACTSTQERPMQCRLPCRHSCAGSFRRCRRQSRAYLALLFHAVQAGTACPWLQQMQQQLAEAAWLQVLVAPGAAQGCSPCPACACWLAPFCWLCSDCHVVWQQRPQAAGSVPKQHLPPAWPLSPAAQELPHVHLQHDRAVQPLTSQQLQPPRCCAAQSGV